MSATERLSNVLRSMADIIHRPNPNHGDFAVIQPLPRVDFRPVNEPGSSQPLRRNAWYILIGSASQDLGLLWLCACGESNPFLAQPRYNLYRELEKVQHCRACCAQAVPQYQMDEQGRVQLVRFDQKVTYIKDAHGDQVRVGTPFTLLNLFPDQGKKLSADDRDSVYATLPTFRLTQGAGQRSPFQDTWGRDTDSPVWEGIRWEGSNVSGHDVDGSKREEGFAKGDPGYTGLF